MRTKGSPITPDEERIVRELKDKGVKTKDISALLGISESTIQVIAKGPEAYQQYKEREKIKQRKRVEAATAEKEIFDAFFPAEMHNTFPPETNQRELIGALTKIAEKVAELTDVIRGL